MLKLGYTPINKIIMPPPGADCQKEIDYVKSLKETLAYAAMFKCGLIRSDKQGRFTATEVTSGWAGQ